MAFFEDDNWFYRYLVDRNIMYSIMVRGNNIFFHPSISYIRILNLLHDDMLDSEEPKSISQHVCIENKNLDEQCSICHNILNNCVELPCKHCFHKNCIIPWFKNRNTCPNCRVEFIETPNNTLIINDNKSSL